MTQFIFLNPQEKWISYCNFSIPTNICILYVYIPRTCFSSSGITLLAFVAWPTPFVIVYMAVRVISTDFHLALSQNAQIIVQPTERPIHSPTGCDKSTLHALVGSLPASIWVPQPSKHTFGSREVSDLEYSWPLNNEGARGIDPLHSRKSSITLQLALHI